MLIVLSKYHRIARVTQNVSRSKGLEARVEDLITILKWRGMQSWGECMHAWGSQKTRSIQENFLPLLPFLPLPTSTQQRVFIYLLPKQSFQANFHEKTPLRFHPTFGFLQQLMCEIDWIPAVGWWVFGCLVFIWCLDFDRLLGFSVKIANWDFAELKVQCNVHLSPPLCLRHLDYYLFSYLPMHPLHQRPWHCWCTDTTLHCTFLHHNVFCSTLHSPARNHYCTSPFHCPSL